MTKTEIREKIDIINEAIKSNVRILMSLVNSRIGLAGLIEDLDDDDMRDSLAGLVDDLSKSIDKLIDSTNTLFDNFNALLKDLEDENDNDQEKSKQS